MSHFVVDDFDRERVHEAARKLGCRRQLVYALAIESFVAMPIAEQRAALVRRLQRQAAEPVAA